MKAFLCCLLIFSGISLACSQASLPDPGASYTSSDTSKTEVISANSTQGYTGGSSQQSSLVHDPVQIHPSESPAAQDSGPIRDWSNPPGFLGYVPGDVATSKRRPLEVKKYQRIKTYRCYSF